MQLTTKPLVSVIVATYNRAYILHKALESIFAQTYPNIQVIVVDDGSTDNTAQLVGRFDAAEYIYIEHAGQSVARNLGLARAKGEFIASLDSDDVWCPDFLEQCMDRLVGDQLDFVFANWLQVGRDGTWFDFLAGDPYVKPFILKNSEGNWRYLSNTDLRSLFLVSCPSPTSSAVIRKSSIVAGWDRRIRIGEDWSLYLDMIFTKPCKAAFTLEKLWQKHVHHANIYDGRKRSEVLEILVDDEARIIDRYQQYLADDELMLMRRRYVATLMELSKHRLIRDRNVRSSWQLFYKSIGISSWFTLDQIPKLLLTAIRNRRSRMAAGGESFVKIQS
ncbi:Glycosyltransferase involved in cell wall bisynthesis [Parapedobacter luteus]|uniref:Glycosyltransferase involved in cell wall bisynthesis n=1 Tax=Parapedobacter luteus TaxID=623280 RepID=A0A1T5C680_9SPHI|nr:glycosyltransferase family 2 protein [Parapedobacter luteus]SKB55092.1 Glycosyltransferase involved in cell wall bisynthesis [Parapedobacter luteus]